MWQKIEQLIQLSNKELENEIDLDKNPERRNYYRFLYHLVKWRKPKVALEIGVESGLASRYMVMAAQEYDGWVIGIDINNLPRRSRENYYFLWGDSTRLDIYNKVQNFCLKHGRIGVVYQDSSHHYKPSHEEFRLYSQLLDSKSIWVCDDITSSFFDPKVDPPGHGMVQYFNELPITEKRLYKDVLHRGNTQGILILNES